MHKHERGLTMPARMARVAIVAPADRLRDSLVAVADTGVVEVAGPLPSASGEALEALRRVERQGLNGQPRPLLAPTSPDVEALERSGGADLLAGEVELERHAAAAIEHGSFAALVGWAPADDVAALSARLAPLGAAVVELPRPPWLEPPTLIASGRVARPFGPIVAAYGPARYADLDPTLFAAFAFVLMFGMMFGDVGHGLLLAVLALLLGRIRRGRLQALARVWPLPFAAGISAALFGVLYGECFGPTGLVPTVWVDPVDEPTTLLGAAIGVGAGLLATSYAIGSVNRWRESGAVEALVAPSGVAGTCIFLGGGVAAAGWYFDARPLAVIGMALAGIGLALLAFGFGRHASGDRRTATLEVAIEVADAVVRTGTSVISFVRLGAFGLMHAVLGAIIWAAVGAVWGGATGALAAVLIFVVGNLVALSLELLVAGVQALRLEYYELFSRIFAGEGHAFAPWHIPVVQGKEEP